MFGKHKIAAIVAEFVGTYVLATAVLAMVVRTQFPFFAAATAGLVLAMVALTIGKYSGAHINPAVTLGLWTVRKVETTTALVYLAAQFLGGYVALKVGGLLLDTTLQNTAAKALDWRVVAAEAIGTFVFVTGVAAAVYRGYEGAKLAGTLGVSLTLGVLVASLGSGGVLNPAVALGINSWSTSYLTGPLIGSVVAFTLYSVLFAPLDAPKKHAVASVAESVRAEVAKPVKSVAKKVAKKKPAKKR